MGGWRRPAAGTRDTLPDEQTDQEAATMTHDDVQAWLDRYIDAWRTYDPAAIGDLFAEDAEYRYHPYDEPERGRATIVKDWVEPAGGASTIDAPDSWDAQYEPYVVEGNRAVATGWSRY